MPKQSGAVATFKADLVKKQKEYTAAMSSVSPAMKKRLKLRVKRLKKLQKQVSRAYDEGFYCVIFSD